MAIRAWAVTHAQERVDRDRLAYLSGLLGALGWPQAKAGFLARWMYGALIGHFSLQGPAIAPGQINLILEILMPKPGPAPSKR